MTLTATGRLISRWIHAGPTKEVYQEAKNLPSGLAPAAEPAGGRLQAQQRRFDRFRVEFNQQRPHEILGMKRPAEIYRSSKRRMPKNIETYEYPGHCLLR